MQSSTVKSSLHIATSSISLLFSACSPYLTYRSFATRVS